MLRQRRDKEYEEYDKRLVCGAWYVLFTSFIMHILGFILWSSSIFDIHEPLRYDGTPFFTLNPVCKNSTLQMQILSQCESNGVPQSYPSSQSCHITMDGSETSNRSVDITTGNIFMCLFMAVFSFLFIPSLKDLICRQPWRKNKMDPTSMFFALLGTSGIPIFFIVLEAYYIPLYRKSQDIYLCQPESTFDWYGNAQPLECRIDLSSSINLYNTAANIWVHDCSNTWISSDTANFIVAFLSSSYINGILNDYRLKTNNICYSIFGLFISQLLIESVIIILYENYYCCCASSTTRQPMQPDIAEGRESSSTSNATTSRHNKESPINHI